MNTLIDGYQRHRLTKTGATANYTDDTAEVDDLRRRVDILGIACQALWELLKTQGQLDETVIFNKMQEIDARDGRLDGKSSPDVIDCAKCGRTNNALATSCMYCGATLLPADSLA